MEPRRFITAFTSARHLSLSWASSIQSISILILSSHQLLCLTSGLFPQVSPLQPCTHHPSPHTCSTCSTHLILDFITRKILGEQYRSLSSSLCSFLFSPVRSWLGLQVRWCSTDGRINTFWLLHNNCKLALSHHQLQKESFAGAHQQSAFYESGVMSLWKWVLIEKQTAIK